MLADKIKGAENVFGEGELSQSFDSMLDQYRHRFLNALFHSLG